MTTSFPHDVTLVPPGLTVRVYDHELDAAGGRLRSWTYATVGLAEHGQAELVLTLARAPEDDARGLLQQPLELMKVLGARVQQGHLIHAGEFTELGAGLLGRSELCGLTYLPAQPLPGVELAPGALALLLLLADELAVVRACGPMRIVARLGQEQRHYPYPVWSLRDRASVAVAGEAEHTILNGVAKLWLAGSHAEKVGATIELVLPRGAADDLAARLAELPYDVAPAFLTLPSAAATSALLWRPGQEGPRAYAPAQADLSCLAGHFCLLVPDQDADGGQIFEDGYAVSLTASRWAEVREALVSGHDLDVSAPAPSFGFSLRFRSG